MMNMKIAVITGGATGIGCATVNTFILHGFKVYVLDIIPYEGKSGSVENIKCDVTDISAINKAIEKIIAQDKKIDVLISNAGVHLSANIENTSEEDYNRVLDVNFKGSFFLLKAVLPHMRKQNSGAIVLVGSDQCTVGKPNSAIYGATKAAIGQLTKSTALDYAKYGIRVNCVATGTIDTPLYRNAIEKYSKKSGISIEKIEEEEAMLQPLGRVGNASEVADLIYFLCSNAAGFMTGGLYPIDGGYTAR